MSATKRRTCEHRSEFSDALRRYRAARGWSQAKTAEESEIDHTMVARLENGQRNPTRAVVAHLARGMALSAAQSDTLFIAAGYVPDQIDRALLAEMVTQTRTLRDTATMTRVAQ